jgi:radical SAM superfamily enzyme YgiQ (UPF0313 family)
MELDVVFVNGPFLDGFSRESRSPAVTKSGTLYYPAWLAYGCGYAEENNFSSKLIDSIADKISFQDSVDLIVNLKPKVIVIGTSTPSIDADLTFSKELKLFLPNSLVILVGTHASSCASSIVAEFDFIDLVARREYDITIVQILKALKNNQIDCRPLVCGSMSRQPFYYEKYGEKIYSFSDIIHDLGLYLPNNPDMSIEEIDYICDTVNRSIN